MEMELVRLLCYDLIGPIDSTTFEANEKKNSKRIKNVKSNMLFTDSKFMLKLRQKSWHNLVRS